jgi:hypothetical protein
MNLGKQLQSMVARGVAEVGRSPPFGAGERFRYYLRRPRT